MSWVGLKIVRPLAALSALAAVALPTLASAQPSSSDFTHAVRYDAAGRAVGTIAPDPDGPGPLKHLATRTTYNHKGQVTKVETGELSSWKSQDVLPKNWSGFSVHTRVETVYDADRRKVRETTRGSNNVAVSLTQFSYDNRGRLECTAVRMNPAAYGSLPASACALGSEGSDGPDRITRTIYDAAGQTVQIRRAVGTNVEIAEVTYRYTPNGKIEQLVDANGNRAEQRYDGHDRQSKWVFPAKARPANFDDTSPAAALASAGALNEGDYEQYSYDNNGNRTKLRKRDGREIGYFYDALNRVTKKDLCASGASCASLPATYRRDVFYTYDNRDLQTSIRFDNAGGPGSITAWDGFGRQKSLADTMDGASKTLTYRYDKNGNRIRITHPDARYWQIEHDGLGRAITLKENTAQIGLMSYDQRGLPKQRRYPIYSYNTVTTPTYDAAGRIVSLSHDLYSSAADVTHSYGYIPSGQLDFAARDNDSYAWDGQDPGQEYGRNYITNGLNQYTGVGADAYCYDANGNLTADGESVYLYDVENRLVEKRAQGSGNTNCNAVAYNGALDAKLHYDPLGRLYKVEGFHNGTPQGTSRMLYDGDAMVLEYNGSGAVTGRYVHGTNADADDPLIWYEGSTVSASKRHLLLANYQGSIIAVANVFGLLEHVNSYDEYGINGSTNAGRFQYTGQMWLEELGMYYYKARIYSPMLGRFLQTDPIGYEDQFNLYAYVANDPINGVDPTGQYECVNNGDNTMTCTGQGLADIAAMYIYIAGVKSGILSPPPPPLNSESSGNEGSGSDGGDVPASDRNVDSSDNGGPPLDDPPPSFKPPPPPMVERPIEPPVDRQFNGRPGNNQAQNRQVRDAARAEGLNAQQRRELGRAVETESRQYGGNLGYQEIRQIAREIKSGQY